MCVNPKSRLVKNATYHGNSMTHLVEIFISLANFGILHVKISRVATCVGMKL